MGQLGRGQVHVPREKFAEFFGLPDDVLVRHVEMDWSRETVIIYLAGPDLPQVVEGAESPVLSLSRKKKGAKAEVTGTRPTSLGQETQPMPCSNEYRHVPHNWNSPKFGEVWCVGKENDNDYLTKNAAEPEVLMEKQCDNKTRHGMHPWGLHYHCPGGD